MKVNKRKKLSDFANRRSYPLKCIYSTRNGLWIMSSFVGLVCAPGILRILRVEGSYGYKHYMRLNRDMEYRGVNLYDKSCRKIGLKERTIYRNMTNEI